MPMNIDDIKTDEITVPPDHAIFTVIFGHQRALAIKYGPIEERNGFWHPDFDNIPHIDSPKLQAWIKDMFWRTTEEIAEAIESTNDFTNYGAWRNTWTQDADVRHFFEEMADALHFLTEVSVAVGIDPADLDDFWSSVQAKGYQCLAYVTQPRIKYLSAEVIFALGLAANCLKNKPWKLSQMSTDHIKFIDRLHKTWIRFLDFWCGCGFTREDVYRLYMKKNLVNQFRQRSSY